MRALVRQRRLLPLSGGAAALVCVLAVSLGLQVSGYGLLPDPGGAGSDGRGVFAGQEALPPLTGRFTGEASGRAVAEQVLRDVVLTSAQAEREREPASVDAAAPVAAAGPQVSNDDVAAAREVLRLPYDDRGDARTREPGEPATCTSSGPTAWYRLRLARPLALVAVASGSSAVADASNNATGLGVFTGDARPGEQVGCSTRDGTVYVQGQPGTTYWFQVAAPELAPVSFVLRPQGATRLASATAQGSLPNAGSSFARLSGDGSTLVFASAAQDLHSGVDPHCRSPIDAVNSVSGGGALPTSAEHRVVGNLGWCHHLYARDLRTGALELLDVRPDGRSGGDTTGPAGGAVSADGRFVAFWLMANDVVPGDANPGMDLVVRDRRLQRWHLLRAPDGSQPYQPQLLGPPPSISANGRFVVFAHGSAQLAELAPCTHVPDVQRTCRQVYRWDLRSGQVVRVSRSVDGGLVRGSGEPQAVGVTDDGSVVTYLSDAPDIVPDDTNGAYDLFQYDARRGRTSRVSVDAAGEQLPRGVATASRQADVTPDARHVAFRTQDPALAADDNAQWDVYVRDGRTGAVSAATRDSAGQFGYQLDDAVRSVMMLALSADGRWVAFMDEHEDLVEHDVNGDSDVFLHDRRTGVTRIAVLQPDGSQPQPGYAAWAPSLSGDGRLLAFGGGRFDGRPESGCYCSQVWTRSLR